MRLLLVPTDATAVVVLEGEGTDRERVKKERRGSY